MKCTNCYRTKKENNNQLCPRCEQQLTRNIADLIKLYKEAHYCLLPQQGGQGTNSGEPTIGINLAALDWVSGNEILQLLHEWEKQIREDRNLTPPALIPYSGSIEQEVINTVKFHQTHLPWALEQPWITDYAKELNKLHSTGMTAARRQIDPVKRIPCPSDVEDNQVCNYLIPVKGDDLLEAIMCKKCKTNWTAARLVAVALSDQRLEIWLDSEAISHWVGITERQVLKIVASKSIPKKGKLIELQSFMRSRIK